MKVLLAIIFSFLTFLCFGQVYKNSNVVYDLTIPYKPAIISILADTGKLNSSVVDGKIEKMTFTGVTPGKYKIEITGERQITVIRDSIVIKQEQNLVLNFKFNGPCLYEHPANYIPTCPKNHTDSIVPIVYGLVVSSDNTYEKIEQK